MLFGVCLAFPAAGGGRVFPEDGEGPYDRVLGVPG